MSSDLVIGLKKLRQSIQAELTINFWTFASDVEASVADEVGRANEHVVFFWQGRWDSKERGRMTYRFFGVWSLHPQTVGSDEGS